MRWNVFLVVALVAAVFAEESMEDLVPLPFERLGELNSPCRSVKDCRRFGYTCKNNRTCQCDMWYIPDPQLRKCVGGVGQKCLYDEHCIEGAYCQNQAVCKCKETSPLPYEDGLICAGGETVSNSLKMTCMLMVFYIMIVWN